LNRHEQYILGRVLNEGIGVEKNLSVGVFLMQIKIILLLRMISPFIFNMGVEMNLLKAVSFYTLAAGQGLATAQNNLAWCYQHGVGVEKDLSEAVSLYTMATERNHAGAQNNLASCYNFGEGV
jgi:TPR repeat protein